MPVVEVGERNWQAESIDEAVSWLRRHTELPGGNAEIEVKEVGVLIRDRGRLLRERSTYGPISVFSVLPGSDFPRTSSLD
jgi:hypothetical protein